MTPGARVAGVLVDVKPTAGHVLWTEAGWVYWRALDGEIRATKTEDIGEGEST